MVFDRAYHPSLDGATGWLNSEPLTLERLRGRVVLVDFWTFTCINWIRTAPYVRAWSERYRDDGLVVIGVHTPEFSFEHDVDLVRRATVDRSIDHPVAVDNDYAVWTAFANNFWPALYAIDTDGTVRDYHPGEGRYRQPERVIQRLLGVDREPVPVVAAGLEVAANWDQVRSPETYLGYGRGERLSSPGRMAPDARRAYDLPRRLHLNHWALTGEWTVGQEHVVLEQARGGIALRFHARDVHMVLSRRSAAPIAFQVLLDGEAPAASHGLDVDEEGNGVVDAGRLYNLVRQDGDVRDRSVAVSFARPGVEAYVVTFG